MLSSVVLTVTVAIFAPQIATAAPNAGRASPAEASMTEANAALGENWWKSSDIAIDSSVDGSGYHVYLARASQEYAWQPLASILPDGFDTDAWTGYSCLTGTGAHVVSVVAPASFANSPILRDRGAYAYVIDVATGKVHPLIGGVALKYYSPGCGSGDAATLTRNLGTDQQGTQILDVNAATATVTATVTLPGQYTSAVPAGPAGFLAAAGNRLVHVSTTGAVKVLASAAGQVYDIAARSASKASFLSASGKNAMVYRYGANKAEQVATGGISNTRIFSGRGGRSILVSQSLSKTGTGMADVVVRKSPDSVDYASLDGRMVVGRSRNAAAGIIDTRVVHSNRTLSGSSKLGPGAAAVSTLPRTGFGLNGNKPTTVAPSGPAKTPGAKAAFVDTPSCSVPRNDPGVQVPQPGPAQVERAVDLAVHGNLQDTRPTNYLNLGLASYRANGDFSKEPLVGGGSVPAQIYLGILAQESNFDQASWHALPGVGGNPLIGDYYGSGDTLNTINYVAADCGYGIGQVTTGMRASDTSPYSAHGKLKIAVDYEENIAAGLQILSDKWNQLAGDGITLNGGSSAYIENWYFAVWAYNTGLQPDAAHGAPGNCVAGPTCFDAGHNWGLGWANNPINPDYLPARDGFLRDTYADAAHPSDWPYQERVMGWIENPQLDFNANPKYATPVYGSQQPLWHSRTLLNLPAYTTFCTSLDDCNPTDPNGQYCNWNDTASSLYDHCWWHGSVTWTPYCVTQCATEWLRYSSSSSDPGVTDPHPGDCTSSRPPGTIIVDDLPNPAINIAGCSSMNWSTSGSFALSYGVDANGVPLSKIDTHQIDTGFGGHLFFTHNVSVSDTSHLVRGLWRASLATHLYNVFVHVPSTGGTTEGAQYHLVASDGTESEHTINQHTNADQWSSLGYYQLGSNAQVTLDNVTTDSGGNHDVAFDAVAFVPINGTLVHRKFDAVSLFTSAQKLDTNTPSAINTPMRNMQTLYNWGRESTFGGPPWDDPSGTPKTGLNNYPVCGVGSHGNLCIGAQTKAAISAWTHDVLAAGTSTTGAVTEADWMGFAEPVPAASVSPATAFADDLNYKIKTHLDVQFAVVSGKVVPGSENVSVGVRTGDTHIASFVTNIMEGIQADYGITVPDLSYEETDANTYTRDQTYVPSPITAGSTPGQAYLDHTDAASIDSSGNCVQTRSISGGAIGYQALDEESATDAKVLAWTQQLKAAANNDTVPQQLSDLAGDIYSMFFRGQGWANGSLFNEAAPIWQEVAMKFCANGTVVSTMAAPNKDDSPQTGLVYQSYMPNLYLYLDNTRVNNTGAPSNNPVQLGDFAKFSNLPTDSTNAYSNCDITGRGNGGNPWNLFPYLTEGEPSFGRFCDDDAQFHDTNTP